MNIPSKYHFHLVVNGIGICDASFIETDTYFYNKKQNKSKFYVLNPGKKIKSHLHDRSSTGDSYECSLERKQKGGDSTTASVTLIYNAANGTLSYKDGEQDYGIAFKTYKAPDFAYRLAIYLLDNAGPIEVIGFTSQYVIREWSWLFVC